MLVDKGSSKINHYFWQCLQCRKKVSIHRRSFLERSHLSLRVLLAIIFLFSFKLPLNLGEKLLNGLRSKCADRLVKICHEVMSTRLRHKPIKRGCIGKIIETDESKFGKTIQFMKNAKSWLWGLSCHRARHK